MANEYEATPLEDALIAALKANPALGSPAVLSGIFPRQAPVNTAYPYLVVSERAPRIAVGNGGIEVMNTYPVLISVYGGKRDQNEFFASHAKVVLRNLSQTTLPGGSLLMGAVVDPKPTAAPGSGIDGSGKLVFSDNLSFLVFVQPAAVE